MYNVKEIYKTANKYSDLARDYMFSGMYAHAQVFRQMSAYLLTILRKIDTGEMLSPCDVTVACGYNN